MKEFHVVSVLFNKVNAIDKAFSVPIFRLFIKARLIIEFKQKILIIRVVLRSS